ncbi:MAG: TolC family protein [Phycisphaerae bacterium]|nr:TolC family protein [Phycisphaerae bacterium]
MISERTSVEEVYSPETDALVAGKVDRLLLDGLSLDEAVQIALLNNRAFQSLFQEIGVARADVVQSGLLTNPSISLVLKLPEGGGRPEFDFGLAQELVDLWQIPVRRQVAEAKLEQTIAAVADHAVSLMAEVRTRYYHLLAIQRSEATVRESMALVQQSFELAQHQLDAGAVSQLDVNMARTNVIDASLEMIAVERELRAASADLARTLGLSATSSRFDLSGALPDLRSLPAQEVLLSLAIEQRLDVQMADYALRAAERELVDEYLKVVPSVTAGFELERTDRRALPGRKILADTARESIANGQLTAPSIESRAQRNLERRQIVDALLGPSLQITLPIWDQNQAQIAKAQYRVLQKRKDYEDLLESIAHEVELASAVAENAGKLVRFLDAEALPQASENLDGARRMYEAGEQGILAVIEAQESFIGRRRGYVKALGDYATAMAELERAVGGRLLGSPATQSAAEDAAAP